MVPLRSVGMMRCLVSQVAFIDPLFALAHSWPMVQDDVSTRMIERDKKDRADFLTSVHFNFLLDPTKQEVPWCKAPYQIFWYVGHQNHG